MISDQYFLVNLSPEERKQRYYDLVFRDRSYSTKRGASGAVVDFFDLGIAYRANTREQFLKDASSVLVEGGIAYLTGGSNLMVRHVIKRVTELVDDPNEWLPEV